GGPGVTVSDEINANALGLDLMPAVLADGSFNPVLQISDRKDLEKLILIPLYRTMNISSNAEVTQRQNEIDERLRAMTVKQVYENFGYRYTERFPTRPIGRGTVGLANSGPNENGPEFFIAVSQAQWLNGRYTVIGRVVEGMEVVDRINQLPLERTPGSRGTLIYQIREI
ncbi:MAG: peptidylprolyl isomerase, partial [Gammaproteobacteria bacterium]|nr:peptidylprolyl isomerase [Gammaproteobacteria bacterium]